MVILEWRIGQDEAKERNPGIHCLGLRGNSTTVLQRLAYRVTVVQRYTTAWEAWHSYTPLTTGV